MSAARRAPPDAPRSSSGFAGSRVRDKELSKICLYLRLDLGGAVRPVRLEIVIRDAFVSFHVPIMDDEVIARSRFIKLLLQRKPAGFIQPQNNPGQLLADFVRLRQQL